MTCIRSFRASVAALVALAAGGCSPSPEVSRHTVDEYRADAGLRRAQLARCANDPGALGNGADCINAKQAERLESRRSLRDLPPVQLPKPNTNSSPAVMPAAPSTEEIEVEAPREETR